MSSDENHGITLPALPYSKGALEPHIDEATMGFHHDFHHAGYTSKFLAAYKKLIAIDELKSLAEGGVESVVTDDALAKIAAHPDGKGLAGALRNNGGGWINHSLFWKNMKPNPDSAPNAPKKDSELAKAIDKDFESFDKFKTQFADAGGKRFGSGWVWLAKNAQGLKIYSTPNQDGPHNTPGETALLGLDVWEHAYYLKYQNKRPKYIDAWWNVVNWDDVEERFNNAQ